MTIDEDALEHLVNVANGDARAALNALELAVVTTAPEDGAVAITREVAEESIQRRAVLYDKEGDAHFDTISAFIKSVRGSDPDAALYWLAKMVYAGEDPRFIFRRLLILASEDVGLADPAALGRVVAAAQAYEWVGMPEGRFHLAQATIDLATTDKSNSAMAFFDALDAVEREREADVPDHLRDASRDAEGFGHGAGYLYPHAYRDHWVAQQYLPSALQGKVFYRPSDRGHEAKVRERVTRHREAQLAAMLDDPAVAPPEILTTSPADARRDRWLERTLSGMGDQLAGLRDDVLDRARVARHHVVLDLAAASGLLTWEAVRRTPEGHVWALTDDPRALEALREQAGHLPEISRPVVLQGAPHEAHGRVRSAERADAADVRFDAVVGRNVLSRDASPTGARSLFEALRPLLRKGSRVAFVDTVPLRGQRVAELLENAGLDRSLLEALAAAEEAAFRDAPARFRWTPEEASEALRSAGFDDVDVEERELRHERRITRAQVDGWFERGGERTSLADRLADALGSDHLASLERAVRARLTERTVSWRTVAALVSARWPDP